VTAVTTEIGRRASRLVQVLPSWRTRPVMRAPRSARVRILGWFVVLLAVAIGASLILERQVLLRRTSSRIDTELSVDADALNRQATQGAGSQRSVQELFDSFLRSHVAGPDSEFLTLVDGRPYEASFGGQYPLERVPGFVKSVSGLTSSRRGTVDTPAGAVRYLAVPVRQPGGSSSSGVFVAAEFVRPSFDQANADVAVAAAVSLSMLIIMSMIAWVVAGRVLAPVRLMTDTARSITETDLTRRIRATGADEIGALAGTFNAMLDRLQSAFVSQRNFVSDAGHELRTPITVIRGHLELLDDDPVERAETLALVSDELDRMTRMVDDLLLLAKAERPDFLDLRPVRADELVREVTTKLAALGTRQWSCHVSGSVVTLADRQRLTQALMNLASNAVAHTSDGARITVGLTARRNEYRLWVADSGTGIALEDQARIFERFARGRHERRRSGAGLGLSIVRAIAEAHRGRVELVSAPGRGSTFTLVLPVQEPGEKT